MKPRGKLKQKHRNDTRNVRRAAKRAERKQRLPDYDPSPFTGVEIAIAAAILIEQKQPRQEPPT